MALNIVIASYGAIGKASSALLQHDPYLGNDNENTYQVAWIDLDLADQQQAAEACLVGADIVIILGDNRSSNAASAAVNMARRCAERNNPCYVLLGLPTEPQDPDPLLMNLKHSASNTLLISPGAMREDAMPSHLAAAVQNVLHPLTGQGMIGVDFADIRTILACGEKTVFAIAEATGEKRAMEAARAAVAQLPELCAAHSIICNITGGFDLTMQHFELVGNIVHEAIPDDAVVILSTTLEPDWDGKIQAGITVCMK